MQPARHDPAFAAHDGAAAAAARPRPGVSRTQTVYRIRRTRSFATTPMDIINDARLKLDERMALIWMLSRPDDWQFHPGQMRKAWSVGTHVFYRIVAALRRSGYVKRGEMVRSEDGRYWIAIAYEVSDVAREPDAPIAGEDGEDEAEADPAVAPTCADATVANSPHADFPHTDDLHADDPRPELKRYITNPPAPQSHEPPSAAAGVSEDESDVPLPRAERPPPRQGSGPPMFEGYRNAQHDPPQPAQAPKAEEFLAAWAKLGGTCASKDLAVKRWLRLAAAEQLEACAGAAAFKASRPANWKLPDAANYLLNRMWRGGVSAPPAEPVVTISHRDRERWPQWQRWIEHWRAVRGPFAVRWAMQQSKRWGAVRVPSEFPPPGPHAAEPLEEARAAAMLINNYDSERVFVRASSAELQAWALLAHRFGVPLAIGDETNFKLPIGDPDRVQRGSRVPARWPPPLPAADNDRVEQAMGESNGEEGT
jgi:hypothetical protein